MHHIFTKSRNYSIKITVAAYRTAIAMGIKYVTDAINAFNFNCIYYFRLELPSPLTELEEEDNVDDRLIEDEAPPGEAEEERAGDLMGAESEAVIFSLPPEDEAEEDAPDTLLRFDLSSVFFLA